ADGLMAEFETIAGMRQAVQRLFEEGYERLDAYMPYPDDRVLERIRPRASEVSVVGGVFALLGVLTGYGVQWYLNAINYPLDVGGRSAHSPLAFVPVMFETGVLFCGLATFVVTLAFSGLPALWRPEFEIEGFERASLDRFWVFVSARDPRFDRTTTTELLESLQPLRVVELGAIGGDR